MFPLIIPRTHTWIEDGLVCGFGGSRTSIDKEVAVVVNCEKKGLSSHERRTEVAGVGGVATVAS